MLQPRMIIALQRKDELEHLLMPWRLDRRFSLRIFPVACEVQRRSPEQRAEYRRQRFRDYFACADSVFFRKNTWPIYGLEKLAEGALLGLLDQNAAALGLGVVQKINDENIEVLTAVQKPNAVRCLRIGTIRLDPASGGEIS